MGAQRLPKTALNLTSWEAAKKWVRERESAGTLNLKHDISIKDALDKFITDCEARNLNPNTLAKYRRLRNQLERFVSDSGISVISSFNPDAARDFRSSSKLAPRTAAKHLERLRSFFRFCQENDWITKNPAQSLKAPITADKPTLPFNVTEQTNIRLAAQQVARGEIKGRRKGTRNVWPDPRLPVFVDLLLETGLRIGDASMLQTSRAADGKLFLYTAKTGTPVKLPLKPDLLAGLERIGHKGGYYFIITDSLKPATVAEYWRVKLGWVFKTAGITGGHPHRFRDTAAVNWLTHGVSIETVSVLLGHSDIKVTQHHYSPWVKERQDRLEQELIQKTWEPAKLLRVK